MPTDQFELEVLSPRAKILRDDAIAGSAPLGDLRGRKIGILNNTKSGGDLLLPYVLEAIRQRAGDVQFEEYRIPFMLDPDEKTPRLRELVAESDGVIALTGD